jgi:hypothetical protein
MRSRGLSDEESGEEVVRLMRVKRFGVTVLSDEGGWWERSFHSE